MGDPGFDARNFGAEFSFLKGVLRQHSVLRRVPRRRLWEGFWGKGSHPGSEKGAFFYGFNNTNLEKRVLRRVLRRGSERGFPEGAWNAPLKSTPPLPFEQKSKRFWISTCHGLLALKS